MNSADKFLFYAVGHVLIEMLALTPLENTCSTWSRIMNPYSENEDSVQSHEPVFSEQGTDGIPRIDNSETVETISSKYNSGFKESICIIILVIVILVYIMPPHVHTRKRCTCLLQTQWRPPYQCGSIPEARWASCSLAATYNIRG